MKPVEMAAAVESNPDLAAKMKEDPAGTLRSLGALPLNTDVWIYRVIVGSLSFTIIAALIGAMTLSALGKAVPESVIALGSTALGALALLLRPSDARSQ